MIRYKCKECQVSTDASVCPYCGKRTELEASTIFWCKHCNIPVFDEICPECGSICSRIGSDIRPVFPEERLLIEIILGCPLKYKDASVWNTLGNSYYVDGKKIGFSVKYYIQIYALYQLKNKL